MIEAAMRISNNTLPIEIIEKILQRTTWKADCSIEVLKKQNTGDANTN
jgi:hypothetical protein